MQQQLIGLFRPNRYPLATGASGFGIGLATGATLSISNRARGDYS